MADSFTVFEKFGDVCAALGEADRKELIYAINMYGMYGEEVELPYHLAPIFIALREDIDNSKDSRRRGSKGGRPKSTKHADEVPEVAQPDISDAQDSQTQGVSETAKPEVSENSKPEVSVHAKQGVSEVGAKNESQTKPNQYIGKPIEKEKKKEKEKEKAAAKPRFSPPSVDDVRRHCAEKGYTFDPEAFVAFYASKGWTIGKSPMRDWRQACVTWQKREGPAASPRKGVGCGARDFSEYD